MSVQIEDSPFNNSILQWPALSEVVLEDLNVFKWNFYFDHNQAVMAVLQFSFSLLAMFFH